MVRKLRERQYQLLAQKRHDEDLRFEYYNRTARYFERECENARHYSTWNVKSSSLAENLDKNLKIEQLRARQNKLTQLLKEEEGNYQNELASKNSSRSKRPVEEVPTLNPSGQKLKPTKDGENRVFPAPSKRFQTYFANSSNASRYSGQGSSKGQNTLELNTRDPSPRTAVENYSLDEDKGIRTNSVENKRRIGPDSPNSDSVLSSRPCSKSIARYSRRSLADTNLQSGFPDGPKLRYNNFLGLSSEDKHSSKSSERNGSESCKSKDTDRDSHSAESRKTNRTIEKECRLPILGDATNRRPEWMERRGTDQDGNQETDSPVKSGSSSRTSSAKRSSSASVSWLLKDEDTPDRPTVDLAIPMFRYLAYNDLKRKILDLGKRELHACRKQCWDEALRLRDMRNRLDLLRDQNLYESDDLKLDEELKKTGLRSIEEKKQLLRQRENVCGNTTMYSEEALSLWREWVLHDDEMSKNEASVQREDLLIELEEEWKALPLNDRKRISHLFDKMTAKSALQDEESLTAIMSGVHPRRNNAI